MPATAAGTPRPTPAPHRVPNPVRGLVDWAMAKHNSSLVFLLGLSLGLALVAPQVDQLWLLIVFSVVWGVTIVAFAAQFVGRHERAHPHAA